MAINGKYSSYILQLRTALGIEEVLRKIEEMGKAIEFIGVSTTDPLEGEIIIDGEVVTPKVGNLVIYKSFEYIYSESGWIKLGDETTYVSKSMINPDNIEAGDGEVIGSIKIESDGRVIPIIKNLSLSDIPGLTEAIELVNTNKSSIELLNSSDDTEGSVDYKIKLAIDNILLTEIDPLDNDKANKVSGAVVGNFASLTSDGDLLDSGKNYENVESDITAAKSEAIQEAESKDEARYNTVTNDIATAKSEAIISSNSYTDSEIQKLDREATNPDTINAKPFVTDIVLVDGKITDVTRRALLASDIPEIPQSRVTNLVLDLGDKVNKIEGKGLSTNDFTDADKLKLSNAITDISSKADKTEVLHAFDEAQLNLNTEITNRLNADALLSAAIQSTVHSVISDDHNPIDVTTIGTDEKVALITLKIKEGEDVLQLDGEGIRTTISGKVPNAVYESGNELADKNFVNSSINNIAAFYITKDSEGNAFSNKSELDDATEFYCGGSIRVPTRNDYCVVLNDEGHPVYTSGVPLSSIEDYIGYYISIDDEMTLVTSDNKDSLGIVANTTIPYTREDPTTRYVYSIPEGETTGIWSFLYIVNNTPLTAAQLLAINSGITNNLVNKLNGIAEGATKVESSSINGNIVVNGTETNVYTERSVDGIYDINTNKLATLSTVTNAINDKFGSDVIYISVDTSGFTTTDDYLGKYIDVDGTKILITLDNKDDPELGIVPGTTLAYTSLDRAWIKIGNSYLLFNTSTMNFSIVSSI